ncbi:septum site-determining protein MinC [Paracoccus homiensis]|uniref:Probable septum site-determining protein MinC n=1 Tax=Paracoccus homiensis TaxID=364199 RepID=A0A1I0H6Z8_9RHOB|nr:septum site-determining protein MinC [Paracoccus homiensis]
MQSQQVQQNPAKRVTTLKPFEIRGRFFTAVAVHLTGPADAAFYQALDTQIGQTPQFFDSAPIVLDLQNAAGFGSSEEMGLLVAQMRSRNLLVFGIQHGTDQQMQAARGAGLIPMSGGKDKPLDRQRPPRAQAETPAQKAPEPASRLITEPVRSGQTIFADRGDLVVVGPVSSGAELIASGNIHVYGTLRGRAMAGVNGDHNARIFCHSLDAELLAIAGLYRTSDDLPADMRKKNVQAYLQDDVLRIEAIG